MYRTLFVGLGGVLVRYSNDDACERLAKLSGRGLIEVRRLVFGELSRQFDSGLIGTVEFREKVSSGLGADLPDTAFWTSWGDIFTVDEDVLKILNRVRDRGVELIAASNIDPIRARFIWMIRAHKPFRKLGFSYELKAIKPERAFFERLMTLTVSTPEECLFIDNRTANVDAATKFGLRSILFLAPAALGRVLWSYGVLP